MSVTLLAYSEAEILVSEFQNSRGETVPAVCAKQVASRAATISLPSRGHR